MKSKIMMALAAGLLSFIPAAEAATNLTGIQVMSMDASGNYDAVANQVFNTHSTSSRFKLYVIKGEDQQQGAFLNGPEIQDAPINIPMTSGTTTYTLFADCGNTTLKPYYGLSLFFNLDTAPALSVFAPLNTASTQFFPDWSPAPGKVLRLIDSTMVQSNGKVEFIDGQTKVTITGFNFSGPNVFKLDRVDRYSTRKSGGLDFVGQITIQVSAPPEIANGGVVNGASFTSKVAPGSLFSIFGTDLATADSSATSVPLPTSLAGTSVTVGGKAAPLVFVSGTQINAQVPYEVAEGATVPVVVTVNGNASQPRNVQVVKSAPGIFQFGNKRAVVQNVDASVNTADNPAEGGTFVVAYLTGAGPVDNPVNTGAPAGSQPLSRHRGAVTATINGASAEIAFSGLTPGFIGLTQVNLKVPTLAPGTYPLVISVDGTPSNSAMVSIK